MDENKILLGKILGETYRIQKHLMPDNAGGSDETIYGLLNGCEWIIDNHIKNIGFISNEKYKAVTAILDKVFNDPLNFDGYYQIEDELEEADVSRAEFVVIATCLKAGHRYDSLWERFDTAGSPSECRTFAPYPDEL